MIIMIIVIEGLDIRRISPLDTYKKNGLNNEDILSMVSSF